MLLGLPDGGDNLQLKALDRMWADPAVVAHTLVYPDSPVPRSYDYRRSDLLAVLVSIMQATAPTVIRVQDGNPDPFLQGDHSDHVAVSRFTAEALDSYVTEGGSQAQLVEYRCYNIDDCGPNLSPPVAAEKTAAFDAYLPFDGGAGGSGWIERCYYRWGLGTAWAGSDGDGRAHAFCVRGGSVWNWRQTQPGGPWRSPVDIGGGPIAPNLAVGVNEDGRVEVFGVALDSHDIVTSYQLGIGGPYSPWVSLGNPNGPGGPHTGAPTVGVNADGRLEVFAKNSGGGISTTYQTAPNAGFSPWVDFGGGPDVQETPAVVTRQGGTMELFARTRGGLRHWEQNAPNAGWSGPKELIADAVTSALSAALNADGRPEVFYRSVLGAVRTTYVTTQGTWSTPPTDLGGDGVGPVAALLAHELIFLLARNARGDISASWQRGPNSGFTAWTDLGGPTTGTPALITDSDGWPLALMVAPDNALYASSFVDVPNLAFGPWQVISLTDERLDFH
jgi:hypothetical protein